MNYLTMDSIYTEEVIEGWVNVFKDAMGILSPTVKAVSMKRYNICHNCPSRVGKRCGTCGCFIKAKTACIKCKCPEYKW